MLLVVILFCLYYSLYTILSTLSYLYPTQYFSIPYESLLNGAPPILLTTFLYFLMIYSPHPTLFCYLYVMPDLRTHVSSVRINASSG